MSEIVFNVSVNDGIRTSVTLFHEGVPLVATSEHPNFDEIVRLLLEGHDLGGHEPVEDIVALFDLSKPLFDKFEHLSERVTVAHGQIFFDGDRVNDVLSDTIVKFYTEGNDDYKRLVLFMEKLATNPNEHSRENLYSWLAHQSFSIAPDGDFVSYKSIRKDRFSHNSGKATVDGTVVEGAIPNKIGSVIEMPRSDVQHDPRQGCHTGLHVGAWSYASTFGGKDSIIIKVKVNPRDVVSVPSDCNAEKLRCCRYVVLEDTEAPETSTQYTYGDKNWDDDTRVDEDACLDECDIDEDEEEFDDGFEDDDDDDEVILGPSMWDPEFDWTSIGFPDPEVLAKQIVDGLFETLERPVFANAGSDLADRREARRRELTDASTIDLFNAANVAGVDLFPIVIGKTLAASIPDIVEAIIAVEFPTE